MLNTAHELVGRIRSYKTHSQREAVGLTLRHTALSWEKSESSKGWGQGKTAEKQPFRQYPSVSFVISCSPFNNCWICIISPSFLILVILCLLCFWSILTKRFINTSNLLKGPNFVFIDFPIVFLFSGLLISALIFISSFLQFILGFICSSLVS